MKVLGVVNNYNCSKVKLTFGKEGFIRGEYLSLCGQYINYSLGGCCPERIINN